MCVYIYIRIYMYVSSSNIWLKYCQSFAASLDICPDDHCLRKSQSKFFVDETVFLMRLICIEEGLI